MTLAVDRWPVPEAAPAPIAPSGQDRRRTAPRSGGVGSVWVLETAKLARQLRVRMATAVCLIAPFLLVLAVRVQDSTPSDTLFGQWLHQSGFALPMVMVAFMGQWVLPLLASVVAGDIFSAEDHYGTWKTVLTRSRTRGQIFAGKVLAAAAYVIFELVLLAAGSLLAGLLLGARPVVGLSGQLVPAGRAATLVLTAWATQLPPLLGFCALALLLSIVTRSSPVGIGVPLILGLVMQLASMLNLPGLLAGALLSTPFGAWHGLWVQHPFYGPLREGLLTSAAWTVICGVSAWFLFARRSFEAA